MSESFNPIPITALVTPVDTTLSLLTVTLEFTFYQSSETPVKTGTSVNYAIAVLGSQQSNSLTISGPVTFVYFKNFAISTVVRLTFSGTVKTSDLSSDFPVSVVYSDAAGNSYSDAQSFNLRGGAEISTTDVQGTMYLLSGVSYPAASRPSVVVDFPSHQFATLAFLALDNSPVLPLTNASSIYTIDHAALNLAPGMHTLTAVVNGVVTSSYDFFVVPAPAWVSAIRTSSSVAVSSTVKGLSMVSPFPVQDIFPAIKLVAPQGTTTMDPTVDGSISFAFPLNGLVSASVKEVASLPPTSMDDPAQGAFAVSTNLQTVVGGATPTIQLNSIRATTAFSSSTMLASFIKTMGFLGSVSVSAPLRLKTQADITAQPNSGVEMGYGIKATGSLSITGNMAPTIVPMGTAFLVTDVSVDGSTDLGLLYSGASPSVSAGRVSLSINATFVSTGGLKVQLYSGPVYSLDCSNPTLSASTLELSCTSTSIMDVDENVFIAAFNEPTAIADFDLGDFSVPGIIFARSLKVEEENALYYKDWAQTPLPVFPPPSLLSFFYTHPLPSSKALLT